MLASCSSTAHKDLDPLEIPEGKPCIFKMYQGDPQNGRVTRAQAENDSISTTEERFGSCTCLCDDDLKNFLECGGQKP